MPVGQAVLADVADDWPTEMVAVSCDRSPLRTCARCTDPDPVGIVEMAD